MNKRGTEDSQLKKGINPIKHLGDHIFRSLSGPSLEVRLFWECAARLANNDVSSVVSSTDALLKGLILYQLRQETCTHMQPDNEKKKKKKGHKSDLGARE